MATTDIALAPNTIVVDPEAIDELANAVRDRSIPLSIRVTGSFSKADPRILVVDVRPTVGGGLGVWVEYEIDVDDDQFDWLLPPFLVDAEPWLMEHSGSRRPPLVISTRGFDTPDEWQAAAAELSLYFVVRGRPKLRGQLGPADFAVFVQLAMVFLQNIPPNLIASFLYDVLKRRFVKRGHPTLFSFSIRGGDSSIEASLQTDDSEVLRTAMATFREVALAQAGKRRLMFDHKDQVWRDCR